MTLHFLFRLCTSAATIGWLLLICAGRLKYVCSAVCKVVIPGLLSAVYLGVILTHWAGHPGGFGSLADVQMLFTDPWLTLAGWVHYLAFDLFLGAWEVRDAGRRGIPHRWTIVPLVLTLLFGPIGFLLHLAVCLVRRRAGRHMDAETSA